MGRAVKTKTKSYYRSFEKFSKGISFIVKMLDLTKTQSAEEFEIERQKKNIEKLGNDRQAMIWSQDLFRMTQRFINSLSSILILVAGGAAVFLGRMTIGDLLSFYVIVALLKNHWGVISQALPQIIAGGESLETIYNIVGTNPPQPYQGKEKIAFDELGFHRLHSETFNINGSRQIHMEVLELNNFQKEGCLRDNVIIENSYVDSILHGCINSDI